MNFMEEAYKESLIALKEKEVPIGAVVVMNNKIIASSHNSRIKDCNVLAHAEINAIKKASKILGDWRLNGCDLYVTLKPCSMCMEVIRESRIDNVYYLLDKLDEKNEYNKTNICSYDDEKLKNIYKANLSDFFKYNTNR